MALETVYRINVGRFSIPQNNDTGMYRYWDDDTTYVEKSYEAGRQLPVNTSPKNYTLIRSYTAPDNVYSTARSYGRNVSITYNVTWNFKVDSQFTYMVRLHFCEIEPNVTEAAQRVFLIFIADMLVEDPADVVLWTNHNLVPTYKDYAVTFKKDLLEGLANLKAHID
ncbi:hypothetical protein L6164_023427 [Bauhinia variegata]|uniref:Uncharacterized protein n=1 Tax=Bauhinia variegata TaxID=167791 RepID=A0ACB9MJQ2_BAUVA|nr:hypothetical protein L6164_023427 [Bauhinia variegata]